MTRRWLGVLVLLGLAGGLMGASITRAPLSSLEGVTTIGHVTSTVHVTGMIQANRGSGNMTCHSVTAFSHSGSGFAILHTSGSNRLFICGVTIVAAHQTALSVVAGTGATCGTGTQVLIGSTAASGGILLAAGTPYVAVAPFPWVHTAVAGNSLCILSTSSGATRVSGSITYGAVP